MNLVGKGDLDPHYDDCHSALQGLEPQGLWADLGSGAGFPGIVLVHMFPEIQVHLVESRLKRSVFLQSVLLEAGVTSDRAEVLQQRVETLNAAQYDGLVSRAFATPEQVLNHAERLLAPGGRVLLFLQEHTPLPEHPRLCLHRRHDYSIGGRKRRAAQFILEATGTRSTRHHIPD